MANNRPAILAPPRASSAKSPVIASAAALESRVTPIDPNDVRFIISPSFDDLAGLVTRLENSRIALADATYRVSQLVHANLLLERHARALAEELDRARRLALHDPLTGLPNRALLADRLELAILHARREFRQLAVLMLDLDGFKAVNDGHGHAVGDAVLCEVSRRILASIRADDNACRFGGDEFVVVLADIDAHENALAVAEKIRAEIAKPILLANRRLSITASVGMAIYPPNGSTCDALLERADDDMYEAKARQRGAEGRRLVRAHDSARDSDPAAHTATDALMCGSAV